MEAGGAAASAVSIHPETSVGAVRLAVADLDRTAAFYQRAIGFAVMDRSPELVRLGVGDGHPLLELVARPGAPPRPRRSTGLFHMAILVPSRLDLAVALRRLGDAGWRLSGASDHLVSEALYLSDPEDNGIEIYRDRPRDEWRYSDGELQMATLPLDPDRLVAELAGGEEGGRGMQPGTRIGHVHLQVADLTEAEGFYHRLLGFEVTVRGYPGALFLAAGGYHHHLGVNIWAGAGAPPPPPGSRGLLWFEVELPGEQELERVERRLRAAGHDPRDETDGLHVADPSGNGVLLKAAV
ncbi:MAG TPA: VOC family protein [Solirubrobacterales bacterium]|nr:VOC family protein [Solirubrobacterales bacterium]